MVYTQKYTVKNKAQAQALIGIMVAVIIGVSVTITVVSDIFTQATTTYSVTNETITFAVNDTWYNLDNDHLVSGGTVTAANASMSVNIGNFTISERLGRIYQRDDGTDNISLGTFNISYTWRYGYYLTGTPQTLLGLLPVLIAVILIVATVGMMGFTGGRKRR